MSAGLRSATAEAIHAPKTFTASTSCGSVHTASTAAGGATERKESFPLVLLGPAVRKPSDHVGDLKWSGCDLSP